MRSIYYIEVNLICVAFMTILFVGVRFAKGDLKTKLYRGMLITNIVFCLADLVAGVARGQFFTGARVVIWTSNILYFLTTFILAVLWVIYSMNMLHGRVLKRVLVPMLAVTGLVAAVFITTPWHGLCFTVDEGNLYTRGPLLWLQWMIMFPSITVPSFIAVFSTTDRRARLAVGLFPVFPLCMTVLQLYVYGITVSQVGTTCAIALVYVLFQSQQIGEAETRAKLLDEMSSTDVLTKLRNRRAYELRIAALEGEERVDVLFADLNGLKAANDSKGHAAGDAIICRFADLLRKHFPENEIFRISGDEFVVLSTSKNDFAGVCDRLGSDSGNMASLGRSYGSGAELLSVVSEAERKMYQDKYEYYKRTGYERRKQ